ncbi:hypothetical protein Ocin01_18350 [Orchesella cincta]|uniref:Uncharacterized protein n=1 Tax=Orchesella cincta TaxID=48709 RepID=A0A1D2M5Z0_ORCCI|nr:hypothetical protein Ocin01_18350 [Orchesella cincta]
MVVHIIFFLLATLLIWKQLKPAKVNSPSGFISFMCIQLWGSNERDKYKVELSLPNVLTTGTESGCKSSIKPFLFRWTLNAFTVSDAAWVLKTYPINVYIPVMMDNKLADKSKNTLSIDISLTC